MAEQRRPDEESPLLQHVDDDEQPINEVQPSFLQRVTELAQEPLSPLSKVLLGTCLVLLLLASVFIGLFAGAQHRLKAGDGNGHHNPSDPYTSVATHTSTETLTDISTTTVTAFPPGPTSDPLDEPCFTTDCIVLSAAILSSMDTSKDPCEDFYEYANGGWMASHPLPGDKPDISTFRQLAIENEEIIKATLGENKLVGDLSGYDRETFTKLRDFYQSCMNEELLDKTNIAPLLDVVKTIKTLYSGKADAQSAFSGAQRVFRRSSVQEPNGLTAALAYVHSRGVDALFNFMIDGDVGVDPNQLMLWFYQPGLGLPAKEYYEEKPTVEFYTDVIAGVLYSLDVEEEKLAANPKSSLWPPWPWPPWGGDDEDEDGGKGGRKENKTEKARRVASEVVEFETELARAGADLDVLLQDPIATYNPVPLSNFSTTLPTIDFAAYISSFATRSYPSEVILTYPPYITALAELLDNTSSSTVESYLVVRTVMTLAPYLGTGTSTWKAARVLEEKLKGLKKGAVTDRSEWCVSQTTAYLGYAAGRFFVPKTGDVKAKGTQIIQDIVSSFKKALPSVKWMDSESAKAAIEKADSIRIKVGYPLSPDTRRDSAIASYYRLVKIDKDEFFSNVLSATVSEEVKTWAKLGKRRDLEEWEMFPSTVNAYFNPPANEIVFPAGIMRPPFFSPNWPSYMNYGGFGSVAGHELTHAFDSAGRLYNQHGRLAPWWTNATSEGFNEVQDCISKQYSEYTIDDGNGGKVHLNGNLTSGENIGDSGFLFAYRAWKAQFEESRKVGREYILPGIKHTREQLFFISIARVFAINIKPEAALQRVRSDPHSPGRYRIEGSLRNVPEFAAAFNCPANTKMNPPDEKRCRLW